MNGATPPARRGVRRRARRSAPIRPPTRREFLALGIVAAAGAAVAPRRLLGSREEAEGVHVVVVGAGLAGLQAATDLVRRGHRVTLLEARTRPGGRVLTVRDGFADGLLADLGAARIPQSHRRVHGLVERHALELEPFYPTEGEAVDLVRDRRIRRPVGGRAPLDAYPLELSADELAAGFPAALQALRPVLEEVGDPSEPGWPPPRLAEYDRLSPVELFARVGLSEGLCRYTVLGTFEPAGEMSALYLLYLIALGVGGGPLTRIRGGNDRLPRAMAAEHAERIRYGAAVRRIEQKGDAVRAVYEQAGRERSVDADRMVLAIPFPALRRIEVAPPFSPPKRRAIAELHHEVSARAALQVERRFWDGDLTGFARTDLPSELWHTTLHRPGPRSLLQLYLKGAAARSFQATAPGDRRRRLLAHLEQILPGARDHVEGIEIKAWGEDPWARSAYPLYARGQMTSLLPWIARPEGRVHFAGDQASSLPGWMEGALESGERVAREIGEAARAAAGS